MSEKKQKPLIEADVECQHCGKPNVVKVFKDRLKKPIKGEYKLRVEVEKKMTQANLG